jgi:G:T-mismatch repair DNA endonuclease (very short patch repair protein)
VRKLDNAQDATRILAAEISKQYRAGSPQSQQLAQLGWRTLVIWECEAENSGRLQSILSAVLERADSLAEKLAG